jgi:hypothetical protein
MFLHLDGPIRRAMQGRGKTVTKKHNLCFFGEPPEISPSALIASLTSYIPIVRSRSPNRRATGCNAWAS